MKKYFQVLMVLMIMFASTKISSAQKIITSDKLLKMMTSCTDPVLRISDVTVVEDKKYDELKSFNSGYEDSLSLYKLIDTFPHQSVNCKLIFQSVVFDGEYQLWANIHFRGAVTFNDCEWKNNYAFVRCVFADSFKLNRCTTPTQIFVGVLSCSFENGIFHSHMQDAGFYYINVTCKSTFRYSTEFNPFFLEVQNSHFYIDKRFQIYSNDAGGHFFMYGCDLHPLADTGLFAIWGSSIFQIIEITDCEIDLPTMLSYLTIQSNFALSRNSFRQGVSLYACDYPEYQTEMDWKQLDQFSVGIHTDGSQIYTGKDADDLKDDEIYNKLGRVYAKLRRTFKNNGDQNSYNASYVSWKDIETRKLQLNYEKEGTLNNLFNLRLNQFLKTFCEYGTNPTRSLVFSFYVVLFFGLIFFFFPFEYDNLNKTKWVKKMNQLMDYFTSNKRLPEFHDEEMKQKLEALNQLHVRINQSYQSVPVVIKIFGLPYYWAANMYYHFRIGVLKRLDYSPQVWAQTSGWKRVKGNTLAFFDLLLFVLWGIIHRAINAVTLSLNSFVTLGIGNVVPNGLAKYFAVAEGAMGWFLLSIFSVSLISQLLG